MTAQDYLKRWEALTSSDHYTNNQTLSQDVASLFLPRRGDILEHKSTGKEAGWYEHIYEPAPINAAQILATGQYDLLFSGMWFETNDPVVGEEDHKRYQAYSEVGNRMRNAINASNFNLEVQEFLSDRSAIHTALLLIEDYEGEIVFTHIPSGRYALAENHRKYVDTVFREFKLTARQAEQKFNKEGDVLPKTVTRSLSNPADENKLFTFIHGICPNYDKKAKRGRASDKAWKSVYICKEDSKNIVRESGYDEQPFVCSRYNRWGDSPYGTGPAHIELSRARALQVMKRDILALGSRVSSPGVILPPDMEEWNPYGPNVVTYEAAQLGLPREVRYSENYTIPESIYQNDIRSLEESFLVPLFKLLTSEIERQREKTAYEVGRMLEEQVGRAAPTFQRLNQEVLVPLLTRVFNIMLRNGVFDDLVNDLVVETKEGVGVAEPEINFTSKLAMALKAVESNNFVQWIQENSFILQTQPEKFDVIDTDERLRKSWKNHGLPADEVRDPEEVNEERAQKQQMEAAAMAIQGGQGVADIANKLK